LDKIYSDFYDAYNLYCNGSNAKKRKDGERKVESVIFLSKYYVEKYPEVVPLIAEGNPYLYEEFFLPRYFKNDLPKLLSMIKEKIESFK